MEDRDPELHWFEIRPVTERDLMRGGPDAHLLEIIYPHSGDQWSHSSAFRFSRAELSSLRDEIERYLEEPS